jgi:hypothetical protein
MMRQLGANECADMCQGFRDNNKPRPDQSGTGVSDQMDDDVTNILRSVLEGPYPGESSVS